VSEPPTLTLSCPLYSPWYSTYITFDAARCCAIIITYHHCHPPSPAHPTHPDSSQLASQPQQPLAYLQLHTSPAPIATITVSASVTLGQANRNPSQRYLLYLREPRPLHLNGVVILILFGTFFALSLVTSCLFRASECLAGAPRQC
jgi:hypothetical protein